LLLPVDLDLLEDEIKIKIKIKTGELHTSVVYSQANSPWYPVSVRMLGLQSWSRNF
jgi:hypothetical protein